MSLIIVASTSAASTPAAKTLSPSATTTAPGTIGLGLRLVDLQRSASQFGSVQRGNRLISFGGVRHLHKPKASSSACLPIRDNADFFHGTVSFENSSQLRLGCAVGQISYIKVLHSISSFSQSSKIFSLQPTQVPKTAQGATKKPTPVDLCSHRFLVRRRRRWRLHL
jgi:hypothetical protein